MNSASIKDNLHNQRQAASSNKNMLLSNKELKPNTKCRVSLKCAGEHNGEREFCMCYPVLFAMAALKIITSCKLYKVEIYCHSSRS